MKHFLTAISLSLVCAFGARADQQTAEAQQNLKDLGFYYGEVTGEKGTETNDAVRRYQIRNGLTITGELNEETLQALKKAAAAAGAATPAAPAVTPMPHASPPATRTEPDDGGQPTQPFQGQPVQPFQPGPGQPYPIPPSGNPPPDGVYDGRAVPPSNSAFAGTPYQTAPPEVQHRVVMDAQRILAGIGLYKHPVDGNLGENLEFSLRAYQTRVGLRPTGRLDLETLAALQLLPGPHRHFYPPRPTLPPVRGEWIRP